MTLREGISEAIIPIKMQFEEVTGKVVIEGAKLGCFRCNQRGHAKKDCQNVRCDTHKSFYNKFKKCLKCEFTKVLTGPNKIIPSTNLPPLANGTVNRYPTNFPPGWNGNPPTNGQSTSSGAVTEELNVINHKECTADADPPTSTPVIKDLSPAGMVDEGFELFKIKSQQKRITRVKKIKKAKATENPKSMGDGSTTNDVQPDMNNTNKEGCRRDTTDEEDSENTSTQSSTEDMPT